MKSGIALLLFLFFGALYWLIARPEPQHELYFEKKIDGIITGAALFRTNGKEHLVCSSATDRFMIADLDDPRGQIGFGPLSIATGVEVSAIAGGKRHLWVALTSGGVRGYTIDQQPIEIVEYRHDPAQSNSIGPDAIIAVMEGDHEDIWIATSAHNINHIRSDVPYGEPGSVYKYGAGLGGHNFFSEDDGSFWIIGDAGATHIKPTSRVGGLGIVDAVINSSNNTNCMLRTSSGRLMIGTSDGLYAVDETDAKYKMWSTGISDDVHAIEEDNSERLWIYSDEAIICYDMNENTEARFRIQEGRDAGPETSFRSLLKTSGGNLVAVSSKGICVIDPAALVVELEN
jgi:ligand-binding sensor domain-containing protein